MNFNPLGLGWVGLYAENLSALSAFYADRVGFRTVEADAACVLFDAGAGCHFELWTKGTARPDRKSPSEQSMIVGFFVDRLEAAVADLKGRGVIPIGAIESYQGSRWIHYVDPEGNRFELKDRRG